MPPSPDQPSTPTDPAKNTTFQAQELSGLRGQIAWLIDTVFFRYGVLVLIIINALMLGAETLSGLSDQQRSWLLLGDRLIVYAFVIEIGLRIFAQRRQFFKGGWNLFDLTIVLVSLLATSSGLAAFRALRVLRVLRVVSIMPRMRVVVSALLDSIPGIASVGVVMALIIYVFAVIAANFYGAAHPELFGNVFVAMFTLFQVMTLEGWPDIASAVAQTHPNSWIFFLFYVLIATFTMLNLFVAIVVRVVEEDSDSLFQELNENHTKILDELAKLNLRLDEMASASRADREHSAQNGSQTD